MTWKELTWVQRWIMLRGALLGLWLTALTTAMVNIYVVEGSFHRTFDEVTTLNRELIGENRAFVQRIAMIADRNSGGIDSLRADVYTEAEAALEHLRLFNRLNDLEHRLQMHERGQRE